jgi:hypothetical protein
MITLFPEPIKRTIPLSFYEKSLPPFALFVFLASKKSSLLQVAQKGPDAS